jgi:uncharacterized protein
MRLESLTLRSIRARAGVLKLKKLVTLNGGHFDAYGQDFDIASRSACAWFEEHPLGKR